MKLQKFILISALIISSICLVTSCSSTTATVIEEEPIVLTMPEEGQIEAERVAGGPILLVRSNADYKLEDYLKKGSSNDKELIGYLKDNGLKPYGKMLDMIKRPFSFFCSTYSALNDSGGYVFGRNLDYMREDTVVLLYSKPRDGYASVSMVDGMFIGYNGTDSQRYKEHLLMTPYIPMDGMNEYGLAIATNSVESFIDYDPSKVTIGSTTALRMMLDYAKNVDEAIELLKKYNLHFSGGGSLNYMISDASGKSVIVGFLGTRMEITENKNPWQVLTNFRVKAFEDEEAAKKGCARYKRTFEALKEKDGKLSGSEPMELLKNVTQPNTTWSVVYDKTTGDIRVAAHSDYSRIYNFKISMKQ